MNAARLPAMACGFLVAVFMLAHEASAAEEESLRANSVLAVAATSTTPSATTGSNHPSLSSASKEADVAEDWTEPRRLLLGAAALFIFLAYRRGRID